MVVSTSGEPTIHVRTEHASLICHDRLVVTWLVM